MILETGDGFVPASDNRTYADTNTAQKLSTSAIADMRESGASGQEIIQRLVENSETWGAKTEFSKQKYLKKKQQKYMPRVQFLQCTATSLCRTYRLKNPLKTCNLREDSLGQMLVYANVFAGAQVLVVDTCMGLVIGAIAERQNGYGRILAAYDGQQPSVDILRRFNFDKRTLESIEYFSFKDVANLSRREEDVVEPPLEPPRDGLTPAEREVAMAARLAAFTADQRKRYEAKKARNLANKVTRAPAAVVREHVRATSDALVIASSYDPERVLLALLPYLACSKPFVVYSEYLEPLTRVFSTLHALAAVIDLQLSETWTREQQVLPGRTHPEMTMSACSGYLLTGIKIHELPTSLTSVTSLTSSLKHPRPSEDDGLEPADDEDKQQPPAKKAKGDKS